ncbi:MAG: class I mannose-6-phosphate isomerase [Bryobacteraceae bacterium]
MTKAIRLTPSLREKVWGRTHLAPWFPDAGKPTGEAWFLADRDLPLLVKLIFTSERLSVQVHPDDGEDGPRGKTEMWRILEAEPGAEIALGFREPITRERLWEATRTGEVEQLVRWVSVKAGETYFTPAHTVHAIGAGIVLCEIQQNSDVTYRLWDYGRPREIHVDKAVPIADLGVHPGASLPVPLPDGREELVRSKHFITELVPLAAGEQRTLEPEKCQLWIAIEGSGSIGEEPFRTGEVWLMPEEGPQPAVASQSGARLLRTYVPGADLSTTRHAAGTGRSLHFTASLRVSATARLDSIRENRGFARLYAGGDAL